MVLQFSTNSSFRTKKLGEALAREILRTKIKKKKAFIIGLTGALGGGKTTFLQGFTKGLGIKEKILSPTFVIMKKFKIPNSQYQPQYSNFYHIDCYRIKKSKEILDLELKEIIFHPQNLVAIEWAGRIKKIIPRNAIWVNFEFVAEKTRKITVK